MRCPQGEGRISLCPLERTQKEGDRSMATNIRPVRVAVVGCGSISGIYLENITRRFQILELAACCDLNPTLAGRVSQKYGVPARTLEQILADDSIEIVVNLTPPAAHFRVIKAALEHGKHVYTEKVLAVSREEAAELIRLSDERGLQLCAAPDTFLGAAAQTARFAVESGLIGEVTSCVATLQRDAGLLAERFPFTIEEGGGIGLDVGIYYVTALLSILGPAAMVCGMSGTYKPDRVYTFPSRGRLGQPYTIHSETLLAATVRFKSGVVGSLHFNSASIRCEKPQVALYGTQGILFLPNPNFFGGEVRILAKGQEEPYVLPPTHAYEEDDRGLGLADMAWALRIGRSPRADKKMAYHALELLTGAMESGQTGRFYAMQSTFRKPAPLPRGYMGEKYGQSEPEAVLAFEE